ncbi:MAG TPA: sulfurtransferase [Candidatus Angelobacter sp.]|nr:sulfurtransferase [Candidatus Angelobacter sp.]
MILRKSCLSILAILLAAAVLSPAAVAQAAHPEMVVSTEWLAQHLNDPKVVILHVAQTRAEYDAGHIPGARFLGGQAFIDGDSPLNTELPTPEHLKNAFEELGVRDDSRVVIYTTAWYPAAGRAWFTLDYMGLGSNAALLDGSIQRWRAEKRAISTDSPRVARGSITLHVHPEVRALLEAAKQAAEPTSSTRLVDSRPEKRYEDGHIAGAAHIFWEETVAGGTKDPTLLSPEKLRAIFAAQGIKPDQPLITYCEVGLQASHMYFIAKYLGYKVAMFDGSIHQWSHMEMLPLVPGATPRCPGGGTGCEKTDKM